MKEGDLSFPKKPATKEGGKAKDAKIITPIPLTFSGVAARHAVAMEMVPQPRCPCGLSRGVDRIRYDALWHVDGGCKCVLCGCPWRGVDAGEGTSLEWRDVTLNKHQQEGRLPLYTTMTGSQAVGRTDGYLPSPATTPGSVFDEDKFLVAYYVKKKRRWFDLRNAPFAILIVSTLQICFHIFLADDTKKVLRFEPVKCYEIWRFVTYMLVHDDWYHLSLNVVIQCIFALLLEKRQGHLRVFFVYVLGGVTGVLGASCVHPDLVIGASAAVYALLISNIADIVLNYNTIKYKVYRATCVGILVLFDVIYDIVHVYSKKEPLISWEAHFVGGVAGLLLGLVFFKSEEKPAIASKINKFLFWTGLTLFFALMISFVILTIQIKKCTPLNTIHFRYVYFC